MDEVGDDPAVAILDHRSLGNGHDELHAPRAVAFPAGTVLPVLALAVRMIAKRQQRGRVAIGEQDYVAAIPAVAAIGAALRDVGLTPERDRSRAAVATLEVDLDFVNERGLRHGGAPAPDFSSAGLRAAGVSSG
jgi:hypothetical protein